MEDVRNLVAHKETHSESKQETRAPPLPPKKQNKKNGGGVVVVEDIKRRQTNQADVFVEKKVTQTHAR